MADLSGWPSDAAHYVIEKTRFVIEHFGPREPGSEAERNAQDFVRQELEPYADSVSVEPFSVAPKGLLCFVPLCGVLMAAAVFLFSPLPLLAFLSCLAALTIIVLQFGRYWQVLDPLLPKGTSCNVYAVRRAAQAPRRRIIVNGHADSAYEMRFNLAGQLPMTVAVLLLFGSLFLITLLSAANLFSGALSAAAPVLWHVAAPLRFLCLLGSVVAFLFIRFNVVVPGANDNLSGAFMAAAVFRWFYEQGVRFEETEVCCLVTGSEEAGLRGAKAFAAKHRAECTELETAVIVTDTLRDTDHLAVCVRDLNGTVKNHPGLGTLLREAGEKLGIPVGNTVVFLGSSDATAFTQAGIPATALSAMDPSPPRYYHTRLDTWSNMDADCLARGAAVLLEAVQAYDRSGGLR